MGTGDGSQKPPEPANPPTAEQKARSAKPAESKTPEKPTSTGKPSVVKMPKAKDLERKKVAAKSKTTIKLTPARDVRQPSPDRKRQRWDPRDSSSDDTSGRPARRSSSSSSSSESDGQAEGLIPSSPQWIKHEYGATNIEPKKWGSRPRALILFSGRSRDGDLASFLNRKGWVVVVVDLLADHPADLRNDKIYCKIIDDIRDKYYDVLGVATPCETFSPLRESPPGPRPLRSLRHPAGLLSSEHKLTP